jgi:chitin disaccharide deacetylase
MRQSFPARVVLHADDLGMNRAVNQGILRGFRDGLLTSTSLMSNAPDAAWALEQWKELAKDRIGGQLPSADARRRLDDPDVAFDLGVHLNLTQGRPLSGSAYPAELLDVEGRFPSVFALFARLSRPDRQRHAAIRTELELQLQFLADHGLRPTHLNGHQYIEMMPVITHMVPDLLERFGIKTVRVAREPALWRTTVLRGQFCKWPLACVKRWFAQRFASRMDALGVSHPDAYFGTAHAGGVNIPLMRRFLAGAPPNRLIEVGLHPSEPSTVTPEERADGWHDPLALTRPGELNMLVTEPLTTLLESSGWRLGRLALSPESAD